MLFIKKKIIQFIYKEKFRGVAKLKLVQEKYNQKFKKRNQLCFRTLVSYCYCGDNALKTDFLQRTGFQIKQQHSSTVYTPRFGWGGWTGP